MSSRASAAARNRKTGLPGPGEVELQLRIGPPRKAGRDVLGLAAEREAHQAEDGVAGQETLAQDLPDLAVVGREFLLEVHVQRAVRADACRVPSEGVRGRLAKGPQVETGRTEKDAVGSLGRRGHGRISGFGVALRFACLPVSHSSHGIPSPPHRGALLPFRDFFDPCRTSRQAVGCVESSTTHRALARPRCVVEDSTHPTVGCAQRRREPL